MLALHSTRMAPHLALRAPLATFTPQLRHLASTNSSLKLATSSVVGSAHAQRSFSSFSALRNPQPTSPLRKEDDKDTPSGFQSHFQDGPTELDSGKLDQLPFVSSRPHEDYVWHPVYKPEELDAVKVVRLERKTITDKIAYGMVKTARWGFDFVTGYKHASPEDAIAALKKAGKSDLVSSVSHRRGLPGDLLTSRCLSFIPSHLCYYLKPLYSYP
ncbi:hypothetical protein BCR35DRAFT_66297 [Leucosporidium creatinivorum]|uniref:Alternative oxidase n=1 Tax=Leucosporidium creatinivorum TaxID=106004 RepID=A0A1Y2FHZ6_9BASI|nr:hypothetical protein BCR35DRAFT_66297 [Leucosporidium creatinivorum]